MTFKAVALSLLLLTGCNTDDLTGEKDKPSQTNTKRIEIQNSGSNTIDDIRIALQNSGVWNENLISASTLGPGATHKVQRQCDKTYDFAAKYTDNFVIFRFGVPLACSQPIGVRWTLLY